jgi:hypothetical protein
VSIQKYDTDGIDARNHDIAIHNKIHVYKLPQLSAYSRDDAPNPQRQLILHVTSSDHTSSLNAEVIYIVFINCRSINVNTNNTIIVIVANDQCYPYRRGGT